MHGNNSPKTLETARQQVKFVRIVDIRSDNFI